ADASETNDKSLFRPAQKSEIPLPVAKRIGSSFVAVDASKFEALASWREFVCVLPGFPIAGEGPHDLRVEQFDAVSSDITGKSSVPQHVFLRGSVDGVPE